MREPEANNTRGGEGQSAEEGDTAAGAGGPHVFSATPNPLHGENTFKHTVQSPQ